MATTIIVQAEDGRQVRISEPDEDGDYGWDCEACGASESDHGYQPIGDTIEHARGHLDHRCTGGRS
jgi:hypothetical protein